MTINKTNVTNVASEPIANDKAEREKLIKFFKKKNVALHSK